MNTTELRHQEAIIRAMIRLAEDHAKRGAHCADRRRRIAHHDLAQYYRSAAAEHQAFVAKGAWL